MARIALITGANQGLGFALARGLSSRLGVNGQVYLGSRDLAKGQAAATMLQEEKLTVQPLQIDVTDETSIQAASDVIRQRHGGIDILISNAGARIAKEIPQSEQVGMFVNTNNLGQRRVTEAFRSLLKPGARFIVVASSFGTLRNLDPKLHPLFDWETASLAGIDRVMLDYVAAVQAGAAQDAGWPEWINTPSKIGQVAALKVFARELMPRRAADGTLALAVCPGLVDTDASRPWFEDMSQAQTPDAAAVPIVDLALSAPDAVLPHGELVQHGKVIAWM